MLSALRAFGFAVAALLLLSLAATAQTPAPAAPPTAGAPAAAAPAAAPPAAAATAPAPKIDSGDTAWMLTSVALVLMMTIPGLALFYGGMVRKMNVLSTVMQSFMVTCLVTVLWTVVTYSMAFTAGGPFVGGMSRFLLMGMTLDSVNDLAKTIPESVYMCFQMTFAIITPALICGSVADRMKFSALMWFIGLWAILVYAPVAHWVWGSDGFLNGAGVLDFAGGTVVHINSGVAGLMCALMLGKRRGYGTEPMAPHNLVYSMIGASLLWVGWFGFNAGSAVTAGTGAGMAMAVTQIATATAALTWMFVEWALKGRPSVLGICSGAVAGLVAITPASGFVDPRGALIIGVVAGIACYWGATGLKHAMGYDDALDAFGVHAVGGTAGAILTGVLAVSAVSEGHSGLIDGNPHQVIVQLYGVGCTIAYDAVVSLVLLKLIDLVIGLRVDSDTEREGLDLAIHGEVVQ
ncbi:MAG TPA: ammonium transporter [Stellaceae bacterium]|nr:ammonium transporter [Stellaceae bacterium]